MLCTMECGTGVRARYLAGHAFFLPAVGGVWLPCARRL